MLHVAAVLFVSGFDCFSCVNHGSVTLFGPSLDRDSDCTSRTVAKSLQDNKEKILGWSSQSLDLKPV